MNLHETLKQLTKNMNEIFGRIIGVPEYKDYIVFINSSPCLPPENSLYEFKYMNEEELKRFASSHDENNYCVYKNNSEVKIIKTIEIESSETYE